MAGDAERFRHHRQIPAVRDRSTPLNYPALDCRLIGSNKVSEVTLSLKPFLFIELPNPATNSLSCLLTRNR